MTSLIQRVIDYVKVEVEGAEWPLLCHNGVRPLSRTILLHKCPSLFLVIILD